MTSKLILTGDNSGIGFDRPWFHAYEETMN